MGQLSKILGNQEQAQQWSDISLEIKNSHPDDIDNDIRSRRTSVPNSNDNQCNDLNYNIN